MTQPTDQQLCDKLLELKEASELTDKMRDKLHRLEQERLLLKEQLEYGGPEETPSRELKDMMIQRNMQVLIVNDIVACVRPRGVTINTGVYQLAYQLKENNDTEQ